VLSRFQVIIKLTLTSNIGPSIPYLPSGRAASSPQCSGDFSFVLSFGGSKRKDIEVEKLLSSIDVPDKKYQENTLR
jgi:hypothetical protein